MVKKLKRGLGYLILAFIALGVLGNIIGPSDEEHAVARAPSVETAALPEQQGPRIGAACDRSGNCVSVVTRTVTKAEWGDAWVYAGDSAVLVCVKEIGPMGQVMVIDGWPYAVTGATQTFARMHELTIEVDGSPRPVREYDGAMGFLPGIRLNEMGCG